MTTLVIATGGTIGAMPYKDLAHPPRIPMMPGKGQDFVRSALQKIPNIKTRYVAMEPRDSKLIDDAYRQGMLDILKKSPESMVLITHGTDSLLTTADYLFKQTTMLSFIKDKSIVLTGSMVPLSCGDQSDGYLNLRFALRQLDQGQMSRGIYIVLCDYQDQKTKSGWQSRLYRYAPGRYEKVYDAQDGQRSRLRSIDNMD